jgi:uncharacterized membrane protein
MMKEYFFRKKEKKLTSNGSEDEIVSANGFCCSRGCFKISVELNFVVSLSFVLTFFFEYISI